MKNFKRDKTYIANAIIYNDSIYNRIGGNIPKYFDNKLKLIENYLFYATFEHPQIIGKVFSILIPKDYEFMLKDNIYPNCAIKVFIHDMSKESSNILNTNKNLVCTSICDFIEIEEINYTGNLIKIGRKPNLIQEEDFYYNKLMSDGYTFFMQIDEDFYSNEMLKGSYPFGYGCVYLYCKYEKNQIIDIIAGFWQYS